MAEDYLKYAAGNSSSTTLSSGMSDSATSAPLTSDTSFDAKSGEGMVILDEGEATEEFAYATTKSGGALTIPLANRGLEGGSAQTHASGASVKGIITAGMWNNIVDALTNLVLKTTGAVDTTKVVTPTGTQTLTNKTLTAPVISEPNLTTGSNVQVNGADPSRTIVIPASALSPTTTAGCADAATVEAGTNDVDYKVLDFDKATEENAFCVFAMPDSWDGGTITATFLWTSTVTSGDVIWGIKGRAFANDDAIDQAYGTAVTVTDTAIASGDVHISSATGAMTFAGSPAGGQLVQIKVYRDADAVGDTADADARLIAVKIEYQVGTYSD